MDSLLVRHLELLFFVLHRFAQSLLLSNFPQQLLPAISILDNVLKNSEKIDIFFYRNGG